MSAALSSGRFCRNVVTAALGMGRYRLDLQDLPERLRQTVVLSGGWLATGKSGDGFGVCRRWT